MDLDSPDVEKDFPGLYASDGIEEVMSKKNKDESDNSESDHDKVVKKDLLIGRRKDKKDKSKDKGYAALGGESSQEELDAKSPSKSKKSKTFKFTTKSKDKREKSRDKDSKDEKFKEKDKSDNNNDKDMDREKEHKKREKKDKKDKYKDKDRREKKDKAKLSSISSEELLELGSPIFGVSVSLATERSRCHDGIELPLIVRDCIDYLQEHGLKNEQIYRIEPIKTRLIHFKQMYNNREGQTASDTLDVPTACSLLKLFLKELPEPILTTDLMAKFEEVAAKPKATNQQEELEQLLKQLPSCNKIMLSWILLHFDSIIREERNNKMNAQSLAMLLSPPLQMSHRLLVTLLCHCSTLFADIKLVKYVPPMTSSSPKLPDSPEEIQKELSKQDSLLNQIHSEMNAGFVSKKREEQLWEVQRIITQLKRKLKTSEKKNEKSVEELEVFTTSVVNDDTNSIIRTPKNCPNENIKKVPPLTSQENEQKPLSKVNKYVDGISTLPINVQQSNELYADEESGLLMVSKKHSDYDILLRLQLENQELIAWKKKLQARISAERVEMFRLKQLSNKINNQKFGSHSRTALLPSKGEHEGIVENFIRENGLLENKKQILLNEIFEESKQCIAYQVELAMRKF